MSDEVVTFSADASLIFIDLVDAADGGVVGMRLTDSISHRIADCADALPE